MEQRRKFFKMSLWQLVLVAMCLVMLASVQGMAQEMKVGRVEADQFFDQLDAKDMGRQEERDFYKDRSKELMACINKHVSVLLVFPVRLFGYYFWMLFSPQKWGWSYETIVSFLHWLDWLIISLVVSAVGAVKFWKLFNSIEQDNNSGRAAKVSAQQRDLLLSVRGFFGVLLLFLVATVGRIIGKPILLVILALLVLCYIELRRFLSNGGRFEARTTAKRKKRRTMWQLITGIKPNQYTDSGDMSIDEQMLYQSRSGAQRAQDYIGGRRIRH